MQPLTLAQAKHLIGEIVQVQGKYPARIISVDAKKQLVFVKYSSDRVKAKASTRCYMYPAKYLFSKQSLPDTKPSGTFTVTLL